MRFLLVSLLLLLPHATGTLQHQVDLEPMLHDDKALQKLTILYQYEPRANHGFQMFYVRGDGSLILQAFPERPMATRNIPTCRNRVNQEKVKEIVRLMIQRHFWDLPERSFIFLSVSQSEETLEIHTIAVDDGITEARRNFGVGTYAGKQESMPADFAVVEEQLKQLKEFTLHTPERPCHLAPAIKFWK
jgi:hypothetical protein